MNFVEFSETIFQQVLTATALASVLAAIIWPLQRVLHQRLGPAWRHARSRRMSCLMRASIVLVGRCRLVRHRLLRIGRQLPEQVVVDRATCDRRVAPSTSFLFGSHFNFRRRFSKLTCPLLAANMSGVAPSMREGSGIAPLLIKYNPRAS